MKYLIDKVNQEEAKRIYEIIDFFENNPTITRENVDISHKMLIEFNGLIRKYDNHTSKYSLVSHVMLSVYQQKWDSDALCSYPAKRNEYFVIYMKHSAFGENHEQIIQLEKARKDELQYRKFGSPLSRIVRKIKSLFKK
ncbi:hypothetical protein WAF17_04030 [Bernardetia sp. ABR2-2B]|uniref:hypothetical protein n=1 Tax=Bernardetia sp. ABR2-2B TaxID=3127472 RepID=UPI0030D1FA4D